jgi:hypothetical protein
MQSKHKFEQRHILRRILDRLQFKRFMREETELPPEIFTQVIRQVGSQRRKPLWIGESPMMRIEFIPYYDGYDMFLESRRPRYSRGRGIVGYSSSACAKGHIFVDQSGLTVATVEITGRFALFIWAAVPFMLFTAALLWIHEPSYSFYTFSISGILVLLALGSFQDCIYLSDIIEKAADSSLREHEPAHQ